MRMYHIVALLCLLALPVFAQEMPEALAKRVKELEKANLVLQEDLARTQLALDTTRGNLKNALKTLDDEIAARKALTTALSAQTAAQQALAKRLDTLQTQVTVDNSSIANQKANAADVNALATRIGAIEKSQTALADKQNADTVAIRADYAKELADLRDNLGKDFAALKEAMGKKLDEMAAILETEKNERIAADENANKVRQKMADQAKKDRTTGLVMGGVLGILNFVK